MSVKRGRGVAWTPEECSRLARAHQIHGGNWRLMHLEFPNRSESALKNQFAKQKESKSIAVSLQSLTLSRICCSTGNGPFGQHGCA